MPIMPHKDRDDGKEERPSEKHRRMKSERDPNRPHKSRTSRPKVIDPETGEVVRSPRHHKKDKQPGSEPSRSMADIVPEMSRTSSAPGGMERESFPYPSFSKAHSKEAVNSSVDLSMPTKPAKNIYTPESTDLGLDDKSRTSSADDRKGKTSSGAPIHTDGNPPTPPETEVSQSRKSTPTRTSQIREEEGRTRSRPSSRTSQRSWFGGKIREPDDKSKVSARSRGSKASTALKSPRHKPAPVEIVENDDDAEYQSDGTNSQSALDSNATSVAPKRNQPPVNTSGGRPPGLHTGSSLDSARDSSPRTPTATPQFIPPEYKPSPSPFVSFDLSGSQDEAYDSPQPPPPPPPPVVPMNIPRVDYLMQNGGLARTVPKALLAATPSYINQHPSIGRALPTPSDIEKVFSPYYNLLDQYQTVISKNGSVAVATGYRSIARRLLDRLENVFARELSSEGCTCLMCEERDEEGMGDHRALGWGDVLEWVSGRQVLPEWPAFDFSAMSVKAEDFQGLGISGQSRTNSGGRPSSPVKLDPDIAEEFREHYLRQTKKTKAAVDRWLSTCPSATAVPPPDIDDETLTFTILTHLDQDERPIFNALHLGSKRPLQSVSRAPTPMGNPRTDFMVKTGQAIQRLYRLPQVPRDPESCIYLLKNPELHHLLTTLSLINNSEWEILISGRFDGFLWSGAESEFPGSTLNSPAPSRGPTPANGLPSRGPTPAGRNPSFSRGPTPFSSISRSSAFSPPIAGFPSRGPTPSNFMAPMSVPGTPFHTQGRHPVSNDEDTEIAILAEVEREIYAGMEALEDAFEALHRKAEIVRQALRERGAGLSMAAQSRRFMPDSGAFARLGTPGGGPGYGRDWNGEDSEAGYSESDWGGDEAQSELAPDDSASNISSSRHRRPKRRNERRTPAPVEEEDESEG
jgi:hypothetical protein